LFLRTFSEALVNRAALKPFTAEFAEKAPEDAEEIRNRLPAGQRLAHICRAVEDYIDTIA